MPVSP
jgi:hypothetical protein